MPKIQNMREEFKIIVFYSISVSNHHNTTQKYNFPLLYDILNWVREKVTYSIDIYIA